MLAAGGVACAAPAAAAGWAAGSASVGGCALAVWVQVVVVQFAMPSQSIDVHCGNLMTTESQKMHASVFVIAASTRLA